MTERMDYSSDGVPPLEVVRERLAGVMTEMTCSILGNILDVTLAAADATFAQRSDVQRHVEVMALTARRLADNLDEYLTSDDAAPESVGRSVKFRTRAIQSIIAKYDVLRSTAPELLSILRGQSVGLASSYVIEPAA